MHMPLARRTFAGAVPTVERPTSRQLVAGRVLSTIAALFLFIDGLAKLLRLQPALEGTAQLGYPTDVVFGLGLTLLLCVLAYIVPATSVIGGASADRLSRRGGRHPRPGWQPALQPRALSDLFGGYDLGRPALRDPPPACVAVGLQGGHHEPRAFRKMAPLSTSSDREGARH